MNTITAPEMRHESESSRPLVRTSTGLLIGASHSPTRPVDYARSTSGPHRRSRPVASVALRLIGSTRAVLVLIAIFAAALLLTACGPTDAEALRDAALDLQDAQQQARAEIHHAQALALLAAGVHK